MEDYARSDTHYLLAIYDEMRLDLHRLSIHPPTGTLALEETMRRSQETSLNLYHADTYNSDYSWVTIAQKCGNDLTRPQVHLTQAFAKIITHL